jgi:hypothetical protein
MGVKNDEKCNEESISCDSTCGNGGAVLFLGAMVTFGAIAALGW